VISKTAFVAGRLLLVLSVGAVASSCARDKGPAAQNGRATKLETGPRIVATPNPVPHSEGFGKSTISWDSGDGSLVQVYVSVNGQAERLFGEAPKGKQDVDWIGQSAAYRFQMYKSTVHNKSLAELVVRQAGTPAGPSLTAKPNPVPESTTTLSWKTGSPAWGQLYVAVNDGPDKLFMQGRDGSAQATWITGSATYSFRLYEGVEHSKLLASVDVRKAGSPADTKTPADGR